MIRPPSQFPGASALGGAADRPAAAPPARSIRRGQEGASTVMFVLTLFWTMVSLFLFIQIALIGYTWEVTGYAAYASARSRITGELFNGDYKDVANTVMKNSLPEGWGDTWIVQELPLGIGVVIFYGKSILGIPVPVFGRAEVPYSKLNPFDPSHNVWDQGDNN
jgi:hypothetical protein